LRGRWLDEFECASYRARSVGAALIVGEVAVCLDCTLDAMADAAKDRMDRRDRGLPCEPLRGRV
jgi:hypothetical protein